MRSDANGLLGVLHTHVPLGAVLLKTLVSFLASCCHCNSSDFVQVVLLGWPQIWLHHITDMVFSLIFIRRKCFFHALGYISLQIPTLTLYTNVNLHHLWLFSFYLHSDFFNFFQIFSFSTTWFSTFPAYVDFM